MTAPSSLRFIAIREDHARFSPSGPITPKGFVAALRQVMDECIAHRQKLLLVDTRLLEHAPLTTVDRYDIGHDTAEFWERSIRLSMLVREDQRDPDTFGQRVARNRGLFLGLNTNEAPAMAWLLSPSLPEEETW